MPAQLFPAPRTLPIDTANGLVLNRVNGDTVRPIVNTQGDTVITGRTLPMVPQIISADSLEEAASVAIKEPVPVPFASGRPLTEDSLRVIPVVDSALVRRPFVAGGKDHFLVNPLGDTVPTGVPLVRVATRVPCLLPRTVQAQPARMKDNATRHIQYLDVDQGMSSTFVWSVLQDRQGYIWLGTNGGGASRYDGRSFAHYTVREGLTSNVVKCMVQDRSGQLWFGTNGGGITRYDGDAFYQLDVKEGLASGRIWAMYEDSRGAMWLGTNSSGAIRVKGDTVTHFTMKEGLSSNRIWAVAEDAQGRMWFGTNGGGACMFDGTTFTHFTEKDGLASNKVWGLHRDSKGNMWLATNGGGACRYDGKGFARIGSAQGMSSDVVWSVREDRDGEIWYCTSDGGVCHWDGRTMQQLRVADGMPSDNVLCAMQDDAGYHWFGTDGGGAARHNPRSFSTIATGEGMGSNIVWAIAEDSVGQKWFGTNSGGAVRFNGSSFAPFTVDQGMPSNYVLSAVRDTAGHMWFGTNGSGLVHMMGRRLEVVSDKQGLPSGIVSCLNVDAGGNLWAGTGGGLCRFGTDGVTIYSERTGLASNRLSTLLNDPDGSIWAGTDGGGVAHIGHGRLMHITEREGLPDNRVSAMLRDSRGRIWVGTKGGGLCHIHKGQITYITEVEGLTSDYVWGLLEDTAAMEEGTVLWVSTERGLNRIVVPDSGPLRISTFGSTDGLRAVDFYLNSAHLDRSRNAWWGSGKGLVRLDLGLFRPSLNAPKVQIHGIDLNGGAVDFRNLPDSLRGDLAFTEVVPFSNFPLGLEVPFDRNHLTFHFSGIDWAAPEKVRYSYRMRGISDEWSAPSTEAKADYRNIPHGAYTFEVMAIGGAQQWGSPVTYSFAVLPPWWQTWWAYLFYLILLALIVYAAVALRTRSLRLRQRELEATVVERTAEVVREKREVERQNHEMLESINYARRLQEAVMPSTGALGNVLPESFLLYLPRDIVSGDFYWVGRSNGIVYLAVGDCTGHGVPGAMLSVIGLNSLSHCLNDMGLTRPKDVLMQMTLDLLLAFEGSAATVRDGMDIALCALDPVHMTLTYAGANNPLWVARGDEMIQLKADRRPVGFHDRELPFTQQELALLPGDCIYLFSDGFQDQMGGPDGKKFMTRKFRDLLHLHSPKPMQDQKKALLDAFTSWRGHESQTDDICVMGVRV
jgi:ligand-binding sensor domain-containing protein/serine phosphatase RsbU (regulator of sigma subunit)